MTILRENLRFFFSQVLFTVNFASELLGLVQQTTPNKLAFRFRCVRSVNKSRSYLWLAGKTCHLGNLLPICLCVCFLLLVWTPTERHSNRYVVNFNSLCVCVCVFHPIRSCWNLICIKPHSVKICCIAWPYICYPGKLYNRLNGCHQMNNLISMLWYSPLSTPVLYSLALSLNSRSCNIITFIFV